LVPLVGGLMAGGAIAQTEPVYLAQVASPSSGALKLNSTGDAVSELQQQLAALGYFNGEVTGFFGTTTQAAVIQFQEANGLTADGVVGAATQTALSQKTATSTATSSSGTPQAILRLNDTGAQVTELQRRLTELGYYSGGISGVFDGVTQAAVIGFQQANGLTADGIVGASTEAALRRPAQTSPTATAPSTPYPVTNLNLLRFGSTGPAVSTLQTQLQALGFYTGAITGSFDAQTQASVIAFQQSRGLVADGVVGPQVNAALGNPALGQGVGQVQPQMQQFQMIQQAQQAQLQAEQARREAEQARLEAEQARLIYLQNLQEGRYSVAELQRQLQAQGYNPGDVNGVLTQTTQSAISDAQQKYGLSESDFLSTTPF
jgi:peptidoglycan hydrolase-like protein with peptidoglycan-binding domain